MYADTSYWIALHDLCTLNFISFMYNGMHADSIRSN